MRFHLIALLFVATLSAHAVHAQVQLIFPDSVGWNVLNENEELNFQVKTHPDVKKHFSIEGVEGTGINFDSLGNFSWKPSYDLVDRVSKTKDFSVIFQAAFADGKRERKTITFTVKHVNRPPVVEELPVIYVKQGKENSYQISSDYVYDQDGDPLSFRAPQIELPEGAAFSSQGQFTWTPSRIQFTNLKTNPIVLEFIVQDQPDKAETKGKLRIAATQQDLPPEITIVPMDTVFAIKEDETLNLRIYLSDPNGDDNVRSAGFIASDKRIPTTAFKENTQLLYEFTWTPGYEFVDDAQTALTPELTFFVLDKSNNRTQKKIRIKVQDTENMIKKDALLFAKYRNNLIDCMVLIQQLDANQKQLNADYKKAKKGKKNRSIVNASLGAVTGFTPIVVDDPNSAKAVGGVGGTTVLTLGTLEATEVIGRSKENIMDKIKINIDLRNKIQSSGDDFARKYALKLNRRGPEFDKDIDKLRANLNDQRIVLLELDAYNKNMNRIDDKDIKKVFLDYGDETK